MSNDLISLLLLYIEYLCGKFLTNKPEHLLFDMFFSVLCFVHCWNHSPVVVVSIVVVVVVL